MEARLTDDIMSIADVVKLVDRYKAAAYGASCLCTSLPSHRKSLRVIR